MCGHRGTRSAAAPPTPSPIAGTPGAAIAATASAGTESVGVYSAITISTRVNIICKRVTNMAKDV